MSVKTLAKPTTARRAARTKSRWRGPSPDLPVSPWTPATAPTGPTFIDMLCGAGGSSLGLTAAGFRLMVGMNHWQTAVDTHAANFTYAEHLCEDVTAYPLRRLPPADVLWASPICTEMSPAGGKAKITRNKVYIDPKKPAAAGQGSVLDELGYVPAEGYEATRATHWSVIQAMEIHRFKYVMTENVADCFEDWELADLWVQSACRLRPGYRVQIISLNSALVGGIGNDQAPQWRDRVYCVFTRADMPEPDLSFHPRCRCPHCGDVDGVQTWSPGTRKRVAAGDGDRRLFLVGRYRRIPGSSYGQYWYTCPNGCKDDKGDRKRVEPYIRPAATAIEWSDLGTTIGSRTGSDILSPNTIRRVKAGLRRFGRPVVVNTNHDDDRIRDAFTDPLSGRTTKIGDGVACPPFHVRNFGGHATPEQVIGHIGTPLGGLTTKGQQALTVPPMMLGVGGPNHDVDAIDASAYPMTTRLANDGGTDAFIVPPQPFMTVLRNNADANSIGEPLDALNTGHHLYLTTPPGADPFYVMNYTAEPGKDARMARSIREPLGAQTTTNSHAIVVPYYTKGDCSTTADPLGALSTHDRFALLREPAGWLREADLDELVAMCHYRMLLPRESLRAQRFPDAYIVLGGVGEQTAQAGNAVSANCAQFLGSRVAAAMARTTATA